MALYDAWKIEDEAALRQGQYGVELPPGTKKWVLSVNSGENYVIESFSSVLAEASRSGRLILECVLCYRSDREISQQLSRPVLRLTDDESSESPIWSRISRDVIRQSGAVALEVSPDATSLDEALKVLWSSEGVYVILWPEGSHPVPVTLCSKAPGRVENAYLKKLPRVHWIASLSPDDGYLDLYSCQDKGKEMID